MFEAFAQAIHGQGARVMSQITHRGRRGSSGPASAPLVAPSDVPERQNREIPHALDREEIAEIVQAYAAAALRLQRAGLRRRRSLRLRPPPDRPVLDAVRNRRTDEYGGSLENRIRFSVEVIRAIRAAVGRDFVLGMRVSGDELIPDGLHIEDVVEIVRALDALGELDYFTVSGSTGRRRATTRSSCPSPTRRPACTPRFAARIQQEVRAAVIYAGRVADPRHAEHLLAEGACDLVAMTRALIADPWMPPKAAEGRLDDVRMCVGMQEGLSRPVEPRAHARRCSQNPATGREAELAEIVPAAQPRRVVVVGGGPAGLEAARSPRSGATRSSSTRRSATLGGQVLVAARAPLRPGYGQSVAWLVRQIQKTSATVRLGTEATVERVLADRRRGRGRDRRGAAPARVPGADLPGVATVEEIFSGTLVAGQRVVVVDGTGQAQAGLAADFLAVQGRAVTVLTAVPHGVRQHGGLDEGAALRAAVPA